MFAVHPDLQRPKEAQQVNMERQFPAGGGHALKRSHFRQGVVQSDRFGQRTEVETTTIDVQMKPAQPVQRLSLTRPKPAHLHIGHAGQPSFEYFKQQGYLHSSQTSLPQDNSHIWSRASLDRSLSPINQEISPGISQGVSTVRYRSVPRFDLVMPNNPAAATAAPVDCIFDSKPARYFGTWHNNQKHGKGQLFVEATGDMWVSDFLNDLPHGRASIYFGNGDFFEGEVEQGRLKRGTLTQGEKADRHVFEGTFDGWLLHGRGKVVLPGGQVLEGIFSHGKLLPGVPS